MTLQQIADVLGWEQERIREEYLRLSDGSIFESLWTAGCYRVSDMLLQKAEEWNWLKSLESGDLETFGRLMNESHSSAGMIMKLAVLNLMSLFQSH